jgi:hypothetical protein
MDAVAQLNQVVVLERGGGLTKGIHDVPPEVIQPKLVSYFMRYCNRSMLISVARYRSEAN